MTSDDASAALTAVLAAVGGPAPERRVRLATIMAIDPAFMRPWLSEAEAADLERAGGPASDTPSQTTRCLVDAIQRARGRGRFVEDLDAGTWAPGTGLDAIITDGWPAIRARLALVALDRRDAQVEGDARA